MENTPLSAAIRWQFITLTGLCLAGEPTFAQTVRPDSARTSEQALQEVKITGTRAIRGPERLADVVGTMIFAGKKTEVIVLGDLDANLATNNTRQVFAKTPGVSIWENDGSGIQVGVATRGLSPNRSWEFNVRQNGVDVSSDPFGYPEAYYNPPLEAVERIQVVRGSAGLQFGPQFGGLLNYVIKQGDETRKLAVESQQTAGSYGLFSSFNALGGTVGRVRYYAYYNDRRGAGWRDNAAFHFRSGYGSVEFRATDKLRFSLDYTNQNYESQQPGGLTDAQFRQDARQSSRARNWFSVPWQVLNLGVNYDASESTRLSLKIFGLRGERNSIGYVRAITIPDTINTTLKSYNPRQLDRDVYLNGGAEARLATDYSLFGRRHTLATGLRGFRGQTDRRQNGKGDTGSDYNMNLIGDYPRDLRFTTLNAAAFAENIFRLTDQWSLTPGVRLEWLHSDGQGRFSFNQDGSDNRLNKLERTRRFVLAGVGTEYRVDRGELSSSFYANWSQAYRPVQFGDLTPPATSDSIDTNLKDARGWNADLGYRGQIDGWLRFDVGGFWLDYQDRIGTITKVRDGNTRYQLRTNLGNSRSRGVESYVEIDALRLLRGASGTALDLTGLGALSLFASVAYVEAEYLDFPTTSVTNGQIVEGNLKGKRVENAPRTISRFGATYARRGVSITAQWSTIGFAYADASNTEAANSAATTGRIPGYDVVDLSGTWAIRGTRLTLRGGVNNLLDARYFTRRAGGYPGPGILPAEGRTWYAGIGIRL